MFYSYRCLRKGRNLAISDHVTYMCYFHVPRVWHVSLAKDPPSWLNSIHIPTFSGSHSTWPKPKGQRELQSSNDHERAGRKAKNFKYAIFSQGELDIRHKAMSKVIPRDVLWYLNKTIPQRQKQQKPTYEGIG